MFDSSIATHQLCLFAGFVVEPLFNAFATAAFFEFVNFAIFEMQYLLSIWRARRGPAMDTWHSQRELAVLYLRFYGALLGSIFVTYQSQRSVSHTSCVSMIDGFCCGDFVRHNMPMHL